MLMPTDSCRRLFFYHLGNLSVEGAVNEFGRHAIQRFNETSGLDELHVYVSSAHGNEGLPAWYGEKNLPRLLELKEQWDPKNLFRFNNGLK